MNLDFNVLVFLTGFVFALPIIGYLFRFNIPISIFFLLAGTFMIAIFLATDGIILAYTEITDSSQISENTIGNSTTYSMIFEASNTDGTMYNSTGGNIGRGELANVASSVLVGQKLQCVDLLLSKNGSPTGSISINAYVTTITNVVKNIGSMGISSLTTTDEWYTFCLEEGQEILMDTQMTIGVNFTPTVPFVGNSTNNVVWRYQSTGGFDGSNTRAVLVPFGSTAWTTTGVVNADMAMRIYDQVPIVVITEDFFNTVEESVFDISFTGENFQLKVIMIFISAMFLVGGALIEVRQR